MVTRKNDLLKKVFTHKYRLLILAGGIFACWLPMLLMLFPGTAINDTWGQVDQFRDLIHGGTVSDHHPIFDTVITGGYIYVFVKIFGSWEAAFFSYVLVQAVITSLVFAYTLIYAHDKLKINRQVLLVFWLIYGLLAIFPAAVQTISKDALFSWIFVLFFIQFIEFIRTRGESLKNKRSLILFIITIIFCALTKKVGMYVIIGSLLASLLFIRRSWKAIIVSLASIGVVMYIILPIGFKIFNIENGGMQEMFSLPFQQTARYAVEYGESTTDTEKELIEVVLGDYDMLAKNYIPDNADPVKSFYQRGETADYLAYLKVWAKQGLRHPDAYWNATIDMVGGWFSFAEYKPLMNMNWHNQITYDSVATEKATERNGIFTGTANFIEGAFDWAYSIPIIGLFLTYGLYATWLPLAGIIIILISRQKCAWLVWLPIFLSIVLGCWLAPVSTHFEGRRYLYPVIYTLPLLAMWCVYVIKRKRREK